MGASRRPPWRLALAMTLLVSFAAVAAQPLLVVSLKSVDDLLGDVRHVFEAGGTPQLAPIVDGMILQYTQGRGLIGVDRKKPLGAYASFGEPNELQVVAFVPVANKDQFIELLAALIGEVKEKKAEDGFVVQREGGPIHGRFKDDYCFFATDAALLEQLADPFEVVNTRYDIAAKLDLSAVSPDVRDRFATQIEAAIRMAQQQAEQAQTEIERKLQQLAQHYFSEQIRMFVRGLKRVDIGLEIYSRKDVTFIEVVQEAIPVAELAATIEQVSKLSTRFAALVDTDAILTGEGVGVIRDGDKRMLTELIDLLAGELKQQIEKAEKLSAEEQSVAKSLVENLAGVLKATIKTGKSDCAVTVDVESGSKRLTGLAACQVAEGEKVSAVIEQLGKLVKGRTGKVKVQVELDVAKHKGARIHKISCGPITDPVAKQLLGETGMLHVGVRDDLIVAALGQKGCDCVMDAFDKIEAGSEKKLPAAMLRLRLGKLLALVPEQEEDQVTRLLRESFRGDGDYVAISVDCQQRRVSYRLEVGKALMKLIARAFARQLGAETQP